MNNLLDFKKFYLDIILHNLPSYYSHFNENNFDKNIDRLIKKFKESYDCDPFELNENEIENYLNQKKEPFTSYSNNIGTGIPNTLLNTHYFNFLKYRNETIFGNLQDFVNKLNKAFGNFCQTFQKQRIKYNGNLRVASNTEIFGKVRDDYWTINIGSEQELQYHIFKNNEVLGYGLGFNAHKSRNNLFAIENALKFVASFMQNLSLIEENLKGYSFYDSSLEDLVNIKEGEFILFGVFPPCKSNDKGFILNEFDFLKIFYDLRYRQYKVFKEIFETAISNPLPIKQSLQKNNMQSLLKYKKQIILQGPPGTGKTRLAKEIAKKLIFSDYASSNETISDVQIKDNIYDGEKVKSSFGNTEYSIKQKLEDKIILQGVGIEDKHITFNKIKEYFLSKEWAKDLANGNDRGAAAISYHLYCKIHLQVIQFHPSYTYEDFVRGIIAKPYENGGGVFYKGENKTLAKFAQDAIDNPFGNYVLIIDEINRANLSSVLGELIYALEYREEEVESMYEVDNSNKLVLPNNLYIIGTMNTADRSVGHIDYAIRRRFAFVEVLPKDLTGDRDVVFKADLFNEVASLFIKNYDPNINYSDDEVLIENSDHLTNDFKPEDVWLGHSYFIQQYEKDEYGKNDKTKPIDFNLRIKYEIQPILEEYIKDGILKESARTIIRKLGK